ncbi:MAG: Hpt domain-containing protein, partial [Marinobacter sp.]|nr:Hpt domain-containing protein [Marinobacter sp.]
MAFDADEEILQDFLVEAGEILDQLSEQLVDLEQNPDDSDLLNAIFRGFHTVKGGAGFLQLNALVGCCHSAENVFDTLRNRKRRVNAELMDVVLQALDNVNAMFDQVRNREEPTPAPTELIQALDQLAEPAGETAADPTPAEANVTSNEAAGDITDEEFEQLLDALDGGQPSAETENPPEPGNGGETGGDEITDDEFEALLDDLHGKGQFSGAPEAEPNQPSASESAGDVAADSDLISDDEFERLLDELHGKGSGPTTDAPADNESATPQPSEQPAQKPQPAPKPAPSPAKPAAEPTASGNAPAPVAETTVRVDTKRLDDIMNMVGELVLVRNRLQRLGAESEDEQMHKAVSNLDVVTTDLQSAVMQTRMQPIKKVFGRFPRVVRDLASNIKKEIILVMHGVDTELDKN